MSSPALQTSAPSAQPEEPRCRCGHAKDHIFVSIEKGYSGGGWLLMIFGISAKATKLTWRCRKCLEVLDSTTDPDQIARYGRY